MECFLYSFPNCVKCDKVKDYLKEKRIKYQEVNAAIGDGRADFRKFYSENRDKIQREEDGSVSLPIFIKDGEIIQGLEKIMSSLN